MRLLILFFAIIHISCTTHPRYEHTVDHVNMENFEGTWYVIKGRFTPFERDLYNSIEHYTWHQDSQTIDIKFTYNRGSFTGKEVAIPQSGRIFNPDTNAHWKVSPFRPIEFDFLVIALAEDYSWTAIGVPNQNYLWIMFREYAPSEQMIAHAVEHIKSLGYNTENLIRVKHQY